MEEVVVRTLEEVPEGATHWSKQELANWVLISPTSVLRIWRVFGLQPWRTQNFKISPDPLLNDTLAWTASPCRSGSGQAMTSASSLVPRH
ncbi:hypothetical protein [Streptomyces sp. AM6-12]|uniref:hypothetical protein n=1 Tax=Streptomyces sp. AM6-12 TaxID=3345149 RepID=UPI0037AD75B4